MRPKGTTAGGQELLERHRPYLRYDSQEVFRVASADTIAAGPANRLTGADGAVIARSGRREGSPLSLGLLRRYPGDRRPTSRDRLEEGPDVVADGVRLQHRRRYANRVYGRVVRDGGRTWLQYWLWYYFDQKQLLGFGHHEGDWETVQVGLDGAGRPRRVTFSRHNGAVSRRWEEVERHRTRAGDHPVVYVAPFSHACYSEPGMHLYLGGVDNPDGLGPAVLPKLERFGDWCSWPGRWGRSRGILQRWIGIGALGGRSPASPGRQVTRWGRPGSFHGKGRRGRPLQALAKAACRLAAATRPGRPKIAVRLDGDRLVVTYALPHARVRRARHLYVTVHAPGGDRVLASRAARLSDPAGTVEIRLPHRLGRSVVRTSAFNAARQRGCVDEQTVSQCLAAAGGPHPGPVRRRRDAPRTGLPRPRRLRRPSCSVRARANRPPQAAWNPLALPRPGPP